jgi:hypothetical protein
MFKLKIKKSNIMDQSRNSKRLFAGYTTKDAEIAHLKDTMDIESFKSMKKFIPVSYHKSFINRKDSHSGICLYNLL